MNLADYLDDSDATSNLYGLGKTVSIHGTVIPLAHGKSIELTQGSLAILGVCESRNSNNPSASLAPDLIRSFLFGLSGATLRKPLIDLGNIKQTSSPADTYMALRDVVNHLAEKGVATIILGGTQELTWPLYLALSAQSKPLNISLIDYKLDMDSRDDDFSSSSYVNKILKEAVDHIFSVNLLGFQSYMNDNSLISKFEKKSHTALRLGYVRGSMSEVEPYLRDSNIVSFDMGSVRQGDCPGNILPSPNGLYAEEACQLARYAGLGGRTQCFGIFELSAKNDRDGQSAHLAAQIAWHFIDAYNHRKVNFTNHNIQKAKRFYVKSPIPNVELVFIKSNSTDAWWMEVPGGDKSKGEPILVACSHNDYKLASNGDVPDRWLKALKRIS